MPGRSSHARTRSRSPRGGSVREAMPQLRSTWAGRHQAAAGAPQARAHGYLPPPPRQLPGETVMASPASRVVRQEHRPSELTLGGGEHGWNTMSSGSSKRAGEEGLPPQGSAGGLPWNQGSPQESAGSRSLQGAAGGLPSQGSAGGLSQNRGFLQELAGELPSYRSAVENQVSSQGFAGGLPAQHLQVAYLPRDLQAGCLKTRGLPGVCRQAASPGVCMWTICEHKTLNQPPGFCRWAVGQLVLAPSHALHLRLICGWERLLGGRCSPAISRSLVCKPCLCACLAGSPVL